MKESKIKKNKKPWPTKDAMDQVYKMHLWGGTEHDFYSGEGSHDDDIVVPYLNAVQNFLTSFPNKLSVLDVGCGDFNVGKQLVDFTTNYIGVDIVHSLVKRNKSLFKADNLEFKCLDIATDTLPKADVIIIRQVLQHLSNKEISAVVQKLYHYKYVILTEHVPNGEFEPNKDIISGQGIRIKKQSGVNLLSDPFSLKVMKEEVLNTILLENNKGVIKTICYRIL